MVTGCTDVVRAFVASGGKLVDTAPTYKAAESMVGDILADTGLRSKVFLSDKLELADFYKGRNGLDGLKGILQRLHTEKLDLLQVHSPNDPKTIDLGAMREWKAQGFCRYIGITRTADYVEQENDARYDVVDETILKREKPDFIEVDYAIDDTGTSEERVIAAAADAGVGVLIALPLGRGRVFSNALGKALPDWASEFDCTSWAQFFLKWILGNPNVTAAIPGTDKASHVVDNLGAAYGRLPDAAMRKRMKEYLQSL
jgi:aryl-alcohol dehydrogenase-like predicted oxidoreductase